MSENDTRELLGSLGDLPARPDDEFVERLRQQVVEAAGLQPISRPETTDDAQKGTIMVMLKTEEEQRAEHRQRSPWILTAAAVLLLMTAGLAVFINRGDDTTPATSAEAGDGSAEERVDAAIGLADQFMAAFNRIDGDEAMSLVSDDAPMQFGTQNVTRAETESLFAWRAAVGDRNELQRCEAGLPTDPDAPIQVTCQARNSNRWSDALGAGPSDATYYLRIEGDRITAIRTSFDNEGPGQMVWRTYVEFVQERATTDEFGSMFASHPDGMGIIGPQLTAESVALHARYTEEFEAARTGE